MMKLEILKITFNDNRLSMDDAPKVRGNIANMFPQYLELHHHIEKNKLFYRYPLIQYKVIKNAPVIIGIREGADILKSIYDKVDSLQINNKERLKIFEKTLKVFSSSFGLSEKIETYQFLTPWLALNEKNYEKYQKHGTWAKKKELLEKILIGNIISMSKSLGYTVPGPIKANIGNLKEVQTTLKGTPMLGFLDTFSVNFEIPDYWGIGKSVSRGFGTVIKNSVRK